MRKIGLAGKANLALVVFGGEVVGAAKQVEIVAGAVLAHLVDQFDEAQVDGAPCGGAETRRIRKSVHKKSGERLVASG